MSSAETQPTIKRQQISAEVRNNIASLFDVPPDAINDSTVVDDIEGWDSTSHVGLILQIEDALGIQFDVERITSFENVGELIDECVAMVEREQPR